MRFLIQRTDDGYFAKSDEENLSTTDREELIRFLVDHGEHPTDVYDFVRVADRRWLQEHPDEPDPGAYFMINKAWRSEEYTATASTREGVWGTGGGMLGRDDVKAAVVEKGFPEEAVEARLNEIDQAMKEDRRYNRLEMGGFVVARFGDGYRTRSIGEYNWWPPHGAVSIDRLRQRFHERFLTDDAKIDALIERADREAAAAEGGAL
jgi:hypothetical protein